MTMIVSAHLSDCILIASDKRSMTCDLETGDMHLFDDNEQKIKLWSVGAIAGTGETIFLNRVINYFDHFNVKNKKLKQIDIIHEEIERRLSEGIPKEMLINNIFIFSMFNGEKTSLYSIPIEPFFQEFDQGNGIKIIHPRMHEIKPWTVDVTCFNLPPDMSNLQNFQRSLKSFESFENELSFVQYYIEQLKQVFTLQASIDPSITTSFDLYLQMCKTGHSLTLHIDNPILTPPIAKKLNYWNKLSNKIQNDK